MTSLFPLSISAKYQRIFSEKITEKEVLFLETISAKEGVKCDKIKYLSSAPMLAVAISFIYHEDSVFRLFV